MIDPGGPPVTTTIRSTKEIRASAQKDIRRKAQNHPMMIVLGIDPGTANTGYGVVERRSGQLAALDGGVITTRAEAPPQIRLAHIHRRVCELLDGYDVDIVAMEEIFFGRNAHSAFAVGQARGVVMLAAGQHRLDLASYTPQQIKHAVCGSGRAEKDQVARMVQMLLKLEHLPRPDHAADALAIAICHANGAPHAAAVAPSRVAPEARELEEITVYRASP